MNKFFSRIAASTLAVAMLAAYAATPAMAANANPTFSNSTPAAGSTITITVPATVIDANGDGVDLTFLGSDGLVEDVSGWTFQNVSNTTNGDADIDVTAANAGVVAISNVTDAAVNVTIEAVLTGAAADNYTLSVLSTAGTGAAIFSVDNANVVSVTAVVEPILTFNLDANNADFGTLAAGSFTTTSVTFDLGTNANGGADVTLVPVGLSDSSNQIGVNDLGAGGNVASTYYRASTAGSGGFDTSAVNLDAATTTNLDLAPGGNLIAGTNMIHNGTNVADSNVTDKALYLGAQITAATPAGNYADTLTFTATASF